MKNQNQDSGQYDSLIVLFLICFFGFAIYKAYLRALPRMINFYWHHYWLIVVVLTLLLTALFWWTYFKVERRIKSWKTKRIEHAEKLVDSFVIGIDGTGNEVRINCETRRLHCEVIGSTSAGKSESVIIPWAVEDIRAGRGLVIIDGKADKSFLNKLYAYAKKYNRTDDFQLFSLGHPTLSQTFNPLIGGTADEITERIFSSFEFEENYYKDLQFLYLSQVLRIFIKAGVTPTFFKLYQAITRPLILQDLAFKTKDSLLTSWVDDQNSLKREERESRVSGLLTKIGKFALSDYAPLFNSNCPTIRLDQAMSENKIVYFQLPAMKSKELGRASGKLVLQALQSAVADRHAHGDREHRFFSIFLDDISEYLYGGFVTMLNKSRSANVGVVLAHQALGDIEQLGADVANTVITNTNIKIIMRGNEPSSAEFFAKMIGTKKAEKSTERREKTWLSKNKTGQESVREVEEFEIHPNVIKRELGIGEGILLYPDKYKTIFGKVKFHMVPNIPIVPLPEVQKDQPAGFNLEIKEPVTKSGVEETEEENKKQRTIGGQL